MYNIIKGIILIGLLAVTVVLAKKIYDIRAVSAPLSLQEEAGKLLDNIVKQKDTVGTSGELTSGKRNKPTNTRKELNASGPFLDEEDKELTRQVTTVGKPDSTKASYGQGVFSSPPSTGSKDITKGQRVTYKDKQMKKIELLYGKAASVLEGME